MSSCGSDQAAQPCKTIVYVCAKPQLSLHSQAWNAAAAEVGTTGNITIIVLNDMLADQTIGSQVGQAKIMGSPDLFRPLVTHLDVSILSDAPNLIVRDNLA